MGAQSSGSTAHDTRYGRHKPLPPAAYKERSQMPMAQFHALLALQEAVLTRWDSVPPADRRALKGYLWEFICREWER